MRKLSFIGIGWLSLLTACSPSYLGKSYTPTRKLDIYLNAADVKKDYEVMGATDMVREFNTLSGMQERLVALGKRKGADGIIMKLTEEITGSEKNSYGHINKGEKHDSYSGTTTTTNNKTETIHATFIKYRSFEKNSFSEFRP